MCEFLFIMNACLIDLCNNETKSKRHKKRDTKKETQLKQGINNYNKIKILL